MAILADDPFDKLRLLLQQETFPHTYIHKFIGRKTQSFLTAVIALEARFPKVVQVSARESAGSGQGEPYLALTYSFHADDAEQIVALIQVTQGLPDLRYIL